MSQPPNNQYCRICKWWFGARTNGTVGECRAEPPTVFGDIQSRWPITKPLDWCRAWESAERTAPMTEDELPDPQRKG